MSPVPEERTVLRRVLPSLTVSFLLFAPQFAALEAPRNRYFLFWNRTDTLTLCLAVVLVAAAGLAVSLLVDRRGGPGLRSFRDQVFAVLFLVAIAVNLPRAARAPFMLEFLHPHRDAAIAVLECLLALLAVAWIWLLLFRRRFLCGAARVACLVLSPLAPIVMVQTWFAPGYAFPREPIPTAAADDPPGGTPILLVVFDEWSYERSTTGDDFLAELPSLRAVRAGSFFFTHATSSASSTYTSIPELLYQTADYRSIPGVIVSWRDFPEVLPLHHEIVNPPAGTGGSRDTLFSMPQRSGYLTCVVGFYLPYRRILGDQVDYVRTYSDYPRGDGFEDRFLQNVAQSPQYWRLPGISTAWKKAYAEVFSEHWLRLNQRLLDDFETLESGTGPRTMVFLHLPVPHAPFIYDAEGAYTGPFPIHSRMSEDIDADIMDGSPDDYHRSLGHLDRVVARLVERLRAHGRYDDALIILTSDHAWRNDPTLPHTPGPRVRHVPLLVKAPGQRSPHTVDGPVVLSRIGPLVQAAVAGTLDEAAAARLIETITGGDTGAPATTPPGAPATTPATPGR
jgi:sulfatase-like protein